jgi:cold shock protein
MCGGILSSPPCQEDHVVAHGTVKWFNEQQGCGFITQDEGPDVFAHYSAIAASGFKQTVDRGIVDGGCWSMEAWERRLRCTNDS